MTFKILFLSFNLVVIFASWAARGTTTKYYTYEEEALGTLIGNLSMDLKFDLSEDPQTNFRFMQEDNSSLIRMRKSDGLLSVGERIDRESLCGLPMQCMITTDVVVFFKEKFHLIHVEIHVLDINDHAPVFPEDNPEIVVSENAAVGERFPLVIADDVDVGNNYIQSYQLINSTYFDIEQGTREDGKTFAELVLVKELDREADDFFTFQAVASDGGSPPKSGVVTIQVKVLDSNDNSPQFEHDILTVELDEDAPVGFLLLRVYAVDPDHGENGEVRYDFSEDVTNEIKSTFDIDSISGAVILKTTVDFEVKKSYELVIKAFDLGPNSVPSSCTVTVKVVDVNDNAPEITIMPMTSRSGDTAYITEAAAVESFVALISATDKDSGDNGYVHVSVESHEHFKLQEAYGNTLMIVTTSALDREKIPEYNFTVIAEDFGSPPFKTFMHYTIRVSDENDNAPSFSKPIYEISVMENKKTGLYVGSLVARDPDDAANGKVTYKLLENEVEGITPGLFLSVDPSSGNLYTVRSLDYEEVKQVKVVIQATDSGSPPLSSTALVKVRVVDENDNAPFFTHPVLINGSADVPLPCNAPAGYVALRLEGHDADDGMNAELSYTILEDKMFLFVVNKKSGELAPKQNLALEYGAMLEVKVAVNDRGRSSLFHTATIRFVVTDASPMINHLPVVLKSSEEQNEPTFDVSFIIIGLLGAACAVLLVAIVAVALSHRKMQRNDGLITRMAGGNFRKTTIPSHSIDSSDSNSLSGGSTTVTEQISSVRDESSFSYEEEQSRESDNKMFQPLLSKANFEPVSVWQGDQYTLQSSEIVFADQTSMKDSGKGDSDFNDSDSDISRKAGRKMGKVCHQQAKSSIPTGIMEDSCRTREIPTHTTSTHLGNGGYAVAYHTPAFGLHSDATNQTSSKRDYRYNTVLLREQNYPQDPMFHKMGTLPSFYYQHNTQSHLNKQTTYTRETVADVITTPVASF